VEKWNFKIFAHPAKFLGFTWKILLLIPPWYTTFDQSWTTGEPQCFDQVRLNYVIASIFGDLPWNISLANTSKAWLTWKFLAQLSELGGGNCPHCPLATRLRRSARVRQKFPARDTSSLCLWVYVNINGVLKAFFENIYSGTLYRMRHCSSFIILLRFSWLCFPASGWKIVYLFVKESVNHQTIPGFYKTFLCSIFHILQKPKEIPLSI